MIKYCKEWNIWPKTGGDRTARIYGGSSGPTCLVDVTGNLCINSEFADGGNDQMRNQDDGGRGRKLGTVR